jgi:hypothetical protein
MMMRTTLAEQMQLIGAAMFYPPARRYLAKMNPRILFSGGVRTYEILSGRRRQVSGFNPPGDI